MGVPDGFRIRRPLWNDFEAVVDLIRACEIADRGEAEIDPVLVKQDWEHPDFDLTRDAWVVLDPNGRIVAEQEVRLDPQDGAIEFDGIVHPAYRGQGIGSELVKLAEGRGREMAEMLPPDRPARFMTGVLRLDDIDALLTGAGYAPVRYFWRMEIEMAEAPPAPAWPEGIAVRTFRPGVDEHAAHETMEESFQDHWGHTDTPYEEWERRTYLREDFDPSLWFLAWDKDQPAGICTTTYRAGVPWVRGLGVRRPWRGQGLGLALLLHAFGVWYRRGGRRVALNVDAASPTGATRVYEKAGMRPVREYAMYEKPLKR